MYTVVGSQKMAQRWAALLLVQVWAASALPKPPTSAPGVITGEDMKRVRAADAWLNGGPPPPVWEVKTKADVSVGAKRR